VLRAELAIRGRAYVVQRVSGGLQPFVFNRLRTAALRLAGVRIGARSLFKGELELTGSGGIDLFSVGEDTMVSGPLYVDLGASVRIGNRVHLGHHVVLLTVTHDIGPSEERCGPPRIAPVLIEDGVWIASCVTILPGVTVGRGAVVAAGSVVRRDVPPDTLVAGVPAIVVRHLDSDSVTSSRTGPPPSF
jgi:maltose O-acetyltransferase